MNKLFFKLAALNDIFIMAEKLIIHNSQSSINDDRVGFNGEAENPGIFRSISEDDLLPLSIFFWEKTDFWDAVVLREDRALPLMLCNRGDNRV